MPVILSVAKKLIMLGKRSNQIARQAPADLLGELGDEGCAELLGSILADSAAAEELRAQAIETACAVKSPAMLDLLVELARDPHAAPEQAARATRALGRFDDPRCLAAATERLRDERPGVGAAAVAALVQQQHENAVAAIEPLLADAGLETRKAVLRALRKLAAGSTDVLLRAWSDESTSLEAALALCALAIGVYPFPFTDVMHASVDNLLKHVAVSKL